LVILPLRLRQQAEWVAKQTKSTEIYQLVEGSIFQHRKDEHMVEGLLNGLLKIWQLLTEWEGMLLTLLKTNSGSILP